MGEHIQRIKSLTELAGIITPLPRGGYLVNTSEGYIQFGAPPETLKDTKLLPLGVPTTFVLPYNHFHPEQGISMAEVEFPLYFNYYIRKKKTTVYINPNHIDNMKIVLNEANFGPEKFDITNEYEKTSEAIVPNLHAEMKYFRGENQLANLVEFFPIEPAGFDIGKVRIVPRADLGFDVYDNGEKIVEVPGEMKFQIQYDLGATLNEPFEPPEFGITCLGPSHGFDHEQNTSGFILWINRIGVMLDPPVNSTAWLRDSNVNPKLIDSLILTHCHADHDSGTFQKILEEGRVNVYSTPTVIQSFVKKYSALTRMPASTLLKMFNFIPIKLDNEINIHGAFFRFHYSLHSIPTIGFQMSYRNKTFVYSSDHLNSPEKFQELYQMGIMSKGRRDHLLNFPWDADNIYHEAGVPPLHTQASYLNSLPADIQKKVTVYHIAEKDFPTETDLTLAKFGIGETVYPDIRKHAHENAYRILDVFGRIDIFKDLPRDKMKDLLLIVNEEDFEKGEKIIEKDTPGDKFYVIVAGNVSIGGIEDVEDKVYGTFEYFGEASLVLGGKRSADVIAATHVQAYSIAKEDFLRLIRGTPLAENIMKIAIVRNGKTWNVIRANKYFKRLSSSQVTRLESILMPVDLPKEQFLFTSDAEKNFVYLVAKGNLTEIDNGQKTKKLGMGELAWYRLPFENGGTPERNFKASTKCELYMMKMDEFLAFLDENPGIQMNILFENRG